MDNQIFIYKYRFSQKFCEINQANINSKKEKEVI